MYFDDHYDPNLENDYDNLNADSDTIFSDSQSNATFHSQKQTRIKNVNRKEYDTNGKVGLHQLNLLDSGFSTVKRTVKKPVVLDMRVEVAKKQSNGGIKISRGKITGINTLDGDVKYNVVTVEGEKCYDLPSSEIIFPDAVTRGTLSKIGIYETTPYPWATIRNAVTGFREIGNRVGSAKESQFFKVCLATGEDGRREPRILFFDNPEQYERHFHCSLPAETKRRWNDKRIENIILKSTDSGPLNQNMRVIEIR